MPEARQQREQSTLQTLRTATASPTRGPSSSSPGQLLARTLLAPVAAAGAGLALAPPPRPAAKARCSPAAAASSPTSLRSTIRTARDAVRYYADRGLLLASSDGGARAGAAAWATRSSASSASVSAAPFFYCLPAPPGPSSSPAERLRLRPYDLEVVPRASALRAEEYWTVSATGVVRLRRLEQRRHDNTNNTNNNNNNNNDDDDDDDTNNTINVEAWPLDAWLREARLFDAVSAIPLFRDGALRRRFARWRAAARRAAFCRARDAVAARLLAANASFVPCLLAVQAAVTDLDEVPFAWPSGGGGAAAATGAGAALRSAAAALAAAAAAGGVASCSSSSSSSTATTTTTAPVASTAGGALVTLADFAALQRATRDAVARPAIEAAVARARGALADCAQRARDAAEAAARAVERDERGENDPLLGVSLQGEEAMDEHDDGGDDAPTGSLSLRRLPPLGREARRRRALSRPMSLARAEAQARREACARCERDVSLLPSLARLADALMCSRVAAQGAASAAAVASALQAGGGGGGRAGGGGGGGVAASSLAPPAAVVAFAVKVRFAAAAAEEDHASKAPPTACYAFEPDERAVKAAVAAEALDGIAALVERCPRVLLLARPPTDMAAAAATAATTEAPLPPVLPPPLQMLREAPGFATARARADAAVSCAYEAAAAASRRELERHRCVWSYVQERERERAAAEEAERERERRRAAAAEEAQQLAAAKKAAREAAAAASCRGGGDGSSDGGASSLNVAVADGLAYFGDDGENDEMDEDDAAAAAAGAGAAASRQDDLTAAAAGPRTDEQQAAAAAGVLADSRLNLAQLRAWSAALSRMRAVLPAACLQVETGELRSALSRGVGGGEQGVRAALLQTARATTLSALREATWRADAAEDLPLGIPEDEDDDDEPAGAAAVAEEEEEVEEDDDDEEGGGAGKPEAAAAAEAPTAPSRLLPSAWGPLGAEAKIEERDEEEEAAAEAAQQGGGDDGDGGDLDDDDADDGPSPLDSYLAYAAVHAKQARARPAIAAALTVIDELFELLSMTAPSGGAEGVGGGGGGGGFGAGLLAAASSIAAAGPGSAAPTDALLPVAATTADQVRRDDVDEQLARLDAALQTGAAWLAKRLPRQRAALRAARADLAEEAERLAAALRGVLTEGYEEEEDGGGGGAGEKEAAADSPHAAVPALPAPLPLPPLAPPLPPYMDAEADPDEALDDAETLVAAATELSEMCTAHAEHRRLLREFGRNGEGGGGGGGGGEGGADGGSSRSGSGSEDDDDDDDAPVDPRPSTTGLATTTALVARCRAQAEDLANAWRALHDFGAQRRAWTEEAALDGDGAPLLAPGAVAKSLADVLERADALLGDKGGGASDGSAAAAAAPQPPPPQSMPPPPPPPPPVVAAVAARLRREAVAFQREVLPVVRPLSNPDLQPRHWLSLSALLAEATQAAGGPDEAALAAYPAPLLVTPRGLRPGGAASGGASPRPPPHAAAGFAAAVPPPLGLVEVAAAAAGAGAATAAARALGSPRPPLASVLQLASPRSPRAADATGLAPPLAPAAPSPTLLHQHVLPLDPSAASGLAPFSLAHLMPHRPLGHLRALWRLSRAATAEARAARALAAMRSAAVAQLRVRAEICGGGGAAAAASAPADTRSATGKVALAFGPPPAAPHDDDRRRRSPRRTVCFGGAQGEVAFAARLYAYGDGGGEATDFDDEGAGASAPSSSASSSPSPSGSDEEEEGAAEGDALLAPHERRAAQLERRLARQVRRGQQTAEPVLQDIAEWRAQLRMARELVAQLQRVQRLFGDLRPAFDSGGGGGEAGAADAFLIAETAWQALLYGVAEEGSRGLLSLAHDGPWRGVVAPCAGLAPLGPAAAPAAPPPPPPRPNVVLFFFLGGGGAHVLANSLCCFNTFSRLPVAVSALVVAFLLLLGRRAPLGVLGRGLARPARRQQRLGARRQLLCRAAAKDAAAAAGRAQVDAARAAARVVRQAERGHRRRRGHGQGAPAPGRRRAAHARGAVRGGPGRPRSSGCCCCSSTLAARGSSSSASRRRSSTPTAVRLQAARQPLGRRRAVLVRCGPAHSGPPRRPPRLEQAVERAVRHDLARVAQHAHVVVDAQARGQRGGQEQAAAGGPRARDGLGARAAHALERDLAAPGRAKAVEEEHVAGQVAKPAHGEEAARGRPARRVVRPRDHVVDGPVARVHEDGLGRHEARDDRKVVALGRPLHVVDRALLGQGHGGGVVGARRVGRQKVQLGLAVIRLVGGVRVRRRRDEGDRARRVPRDLGAARAEKGPARDDDGVGRRGAAAASFQPRLERGGKVEDARRRRLALALGHKGGQEVRLAVGRARRKLPDALDAHLGHGHGRVGEAAVRAGGRAEGPVLALGAVDVHGVGHGKVGERVAVPGPAHARPRVARERAVQQLERGLGGGVGGLVAERRLDVPDGHVGRRGRVGRLAHGASRRALGRHEEPAGRGPVGKLHARGGERREHAALAVAVAVERAQVDGVVAHDGQQRAVGRGQGDGGRGAAWVVVACGVRALV